MSLIPNLLQQHTGKMYFSGRKRANTFPKTCEAEKRPVIQLNAAALLLSLTTSAWQRKAKLIPKTLCPWILIMKNDSYRISNSNAENTPLAYYIWYCSKHIVGIHKFFGLIESKQSWKDTESKQRENCTYTAQFWLYH